MASWCTRIPRPAPDAPRIPVMDPPRFRNDLRQAERGTAARRVLCSRRDPQRLGALGVRRAGEILVTSPIRGAFLAASPDSSGRLVMAESPRAGPRRRPRTARRYPASTNSTSRHHRQQPVGRLYRGYATERRRPDHRTAGLRSQGQRNHSGGRPLPPSPTTNRRGYDRVARIERRGRIARGERRRRRLADMVAPPPSPSRQPASARGRQPR